MFTHKSIFKWLGISTLHFLFWIGVYFFLTYFLGYGSDNIAYIDKFTFFLMPITVIISYFFLYFLIPKFLLQKKHWLFVLYTMYTFIISFFFIALSILYGLIFSNDLSLNKPPPITKTLFLIVIGIYFVVLIVIILGLIINNYRAAIKSEDLKNKFLQAQLQLKEQELTFLKMQIHPHFLFNSLNTIYGYALQKEKEAPEMILKLSNLLDYILYQINKPHVLLSDEIDHLYDYINLEKMRFHDTLIVEFNNTVTNLNIQIAPMLLIPFVENAFKHGAIVDKYLKVYINVGYNEDQLLFFSVKNSTKYKPNTDHGIGLENIRRRLTMLYPKAHDLQIENSNGVFDIMLTIDTKGFKKLKNV